MKRITSKERDVLLKINKKLKYEINKITYNKINKIYKNINKILKDNDIEIYDFNIILKEYNVNNELKIIVNKLREFTKIRNDYILKKAINSSKWDKCIINLYENYKKKYNVKNLNLYIKESLLELLKKYNRNWLGYWKIIELDKNSNIKNISLFDKKDKDFFLKRLKINIKKNKMNSKKI